MNEWSYFYEIVHNYLLATADENGSKVKVVTVRNSVNAAVPELLK